MDASFDNEDKSRPAKVARLFNIQKSGGKVELPPVGYAHYIIDYMHKISFPLSSEGYVKHSEIKCWCDTQGLELEPQEHQIIFDSFIEYNGSKSRFEQDIREPAPFTTKTAEEVHDTKQAGLSAFMQGMVKNGK